MASWCSVSCTSRDRLNHVRDLAQDRLAHVGIIAQLQLPVQRVNEKQHVYRALVMHPAVNMLSSVTLFYLTALTVQRCWAEEEWLYMSLPFSQKFDLDLDGLEWD